MREVKDSGISWIGDVPQKWSVHPLKYNFSIISGATPDSSNSELWDGDVLWITPADYKTKEIYVSNGARNISSLGYKSCSTHMLPKGTIVVSKRAPIGSVALTAVPLCTNQGCLGLICNQGISEKFFYYSLSIYEEVLNLFGSGTTFKEISATVLGTIKLAKPSFEEQNRIAQFLDAKCTEIDTLSADIQEEINTLQKYKRSVITEAVTKGLDKNAPMKDSGSDWIGDIPSNWSVSKLGNVLTLRNERNYKPLEEVNLISLYTDRGVVQHADLEKTSGNIAQNADGYKIVHKNDIVVNIILAWMGAMGISDYDGVTSPAYDVYKINIDKIYPHYCHYILRSPAMAGECYKYGRGIMMMRWRTYSTEFKKIKIPLPPIEEQKKIAEYLDEKCKEIDSIIEQKQEQLELIAKYRKSIIYEYVTGKKIVSE
jgi:type I restriction enzyme S subunit